MTGVLLQVENLSVDFETRAGPIHAVRSASLAVSAGECLAIVGESGSGKSVTARSLVGLVGSTAHVGADRLTFEGIDLLGLAESRWRQLRGGRIGFVLQDALTSLDPLRRVGDEVAEPLEVHGRIGRRHRDSQVLTLLHDVGIPDPAVRARQHPHELSGGLRQRALIASAIAAGPSLVIADEPTTALDVTVQAQVLDLLSAKKAAGTAVLLISHDLTVVARMADRIAVMYAGLIVEQGPAAQVLAEPAHPYTADLLAAAPAFDRDAQPVTLLVSGALPPPSMGPGCPYASRCPLADDQCRRELPPLNRFGPVGEVRCWHPGVERAAPERAERRPESATGAVIVEAEGISKRFRSPDGSWRSAVEDVTFALRAGEALGLVGESGSGKTTTAQIVLGMLRPDAGTVRLDGEAWSEVKERERRPRRSRIQIVYQDPLSSFDPRFTVERIVGEALGQPTRRGAAAIRDRIVELLGKVGLDYTFLGRRGPTLSGGQRQRVAIARALAPGPEVIVCDEPVSALDVSVQAQILDLFTELRTDLGVALLFISHDLGVIHQVCDRVLVMKDGRVVEEGDVHDVFTDPKHPYTQSLLAALPEIESRPAVTINQGAS
jgi:peptide/nickel transport system ATP-binding protein